MDGPLRVRNARTGTKDEAPPKSPPQVPIGPIGTLAYTAHREARAAARR